MKCVVFSLIAAMSACVTPIDDFTQDQSPLTAPERGAAAWPAELPLDQPIARDCLEVTGGYGSGYHAGYTLVGRNNDFYALDLSDPKTPFNQTVVAPVAGKVVSVFQEGDPLIEPSYASFGNRVTLQVDYGDETYYLFFAHLKQIDTAVHQHLNKGDTIGIAGHSGLHDDHGDHLHFSIHKKSKARNMRPTQLS
ncbi:MAG: M23 family metallopeptidase [Myxococcales bacterium]|nr:MAG: M23 family metallopeptidase [Myxococcales bacterium]